MAAPTHKITLENGLNYCLIIVNARAAQDLPMGRAKSFPMSFGVLSFGHASKGMPISLAGQGGNNGGIWKLSYYCFFINLLAIGERGWFHVR